MAPAGLETQYAWMSGESVPTFADLITHVRENVWDGEGSKFEWSIRSGPLTRAKDTFSLTRDELVVARWRNRAASPAVPPQQLGAPPMQQPPGWGQPPPPYPYPHQPQQQAPQPQPTIVVQPPAATSAEPPRVNLPGGGFV
jgi:hypothetical protein